MGNENIFTFTVESPAIAQRCESSFLLHYPPTSPPLPSAVNVTAHSLQLLWS